MKKRFMGISLVMALSVTLALIYWFYPHTNPPISSSVISSQEKNTGMVSGSSVSGSSVLVPEVSGSTISGSGSQTGSIVSHSSLPVKFQKPNTEWKERDITLTDGRTLHYVFGEGNPKEVALDKEGIKTLHAKGYGYITPEAEQAMKDFIQMPELSEFIENCSIEIDWNYKEDAPDWNRFPHNFDLEKMIIIDTETGRKEFVNSFFSVVYPILTEPLNPLINHSESHFSKCLSGNKYESLKKLADSIGNVSRAYITDKE